MTLSHQAPVLAIARRLTGEFTQTVDNPLRAKTSITETWLLLSPARIYASPCWYLLPAPLPQLQLCKVTTVLVISKPQQYIYNLRNRRKHASWGRTLSGLLTLGDHQKWTLQIATITWNLVCLNHFCQQGPSAFNHMSHVLGLQYTDTFNPQSWNFRGMKKA